MESPLPGLKLTILRGPRSGETLDFKPGSIIRIGRLKRGNTIAIHEKDISSKHLVIGSKSGKWTIQDLDSFNGTFLNSNPLPANTPVDLHDDDTVKFGGETTMLVKFIHAVDEESQLNRNPRRQANARATRSQKKNEECAENLDVECQMVENKGKVTQTSPRQMNARVTRRQANARVTRNQKNDEEFFENMEVECEVVEIETPKRQVNAKVTKRQANARVTRNQKENEEIVENLEARCEAVENEGRVSRKGRGRRKNIQEMPPAIVEVQDEGNENLKTKEGACGGHIEGKNSEMQMEEESKVTRKGRGRRRKLPEMVPEMIDVEVENNGNLRPEEAASVIDAEETSDKVDDKGEDEVNRDVGETDNVIGDKVESSVKEKGPDLEKMTLGEWFDYIEVYLPKQITAATEEMIEGMRRKAEKLHEYMVQKKREKGKL